MAIPVILKGDTSLAIPLTLAGGYEYDGCALLVGFNGVVREFADLRAGATVSLMYTADETAAMPLGTAKVNLQLRNAAGSVRSLPWQKIKVTDIPGEAYAGTGIIIDPASLLVDDAAAGDSLGAVKKKLNAVLAFLRSGAVCIAACVSMACFGDLTPDTKLDDVPGNATISNIVEAAGVSAGQHGTDGAAVTNIARNVSVEEIGVWAKGSRIALGDDSHADSWYSNIAIGSHAKVGAAHSIAIGSYAETKNTDTVAIGNHAAANDKEAVAIGYNAVTHGEGTITFGRNGTEPSSVYIGNRTLAQAVAAAESDPSVPDWAKQAEPPVGMTGNAVVVNNGKFVMNDGTQVNASALTGALTQSGANALYFPKAQGDAWESYWGGSNVVFEVTNYYGNTSGEIPKLRIKELITEGAGAPYYKTVWDDSNKFAVFTDAITQQVAKATADCKLECASQSAPRAWGTVTDKGIDNPVANTVWMTSPSTVFAGGTEYQRVAVGEGAICVLTRNGAAAYTTGREGTFRFQDDGGECYFGFAKTDSYTIGCNTDGITVSGGVVTLRYDVIMGDGECPIVYYTPTINHAAWVQLNNADGTAAEGAPYTVTWAMEGGTHLALLNVGDAPQGFFRAETSVAGDMVFETNMKMRLDGGVLCTDGHTVIYPHADGSWSTVK